MTPDVIFPDLFLFIRLSPRYGLLLSRFFQPSAAAPFRLHSVCGACMFCPGDRRENSFPVLRFLCSRNGFVIVQQLPCRAFGRDCRAQFILRYFPHHLLTITRPLSFCGGNGTGMGGSNPPPRCSKHHPRQIRTRQ